MASVSTGNAPAIFDLKSATLPLLAVVLRTFDLKALEVELEARISASPDLFNQDPVVIDLAPLREQGASVDFEALVALLRRYKMAPTAAKGGSPEQMAAALALGLVEAPDLSPVGTTSAESRAVPEGSAAETSDAEDARDSEGSRHWSAPATATVIVDKPLRSGQQVYARGGDIVVLAAVNFGAEVIADGNIHVYAPLRGKAIAGARGNTEARIFTTCLEPELVSIAGIYRTTETAIPAEVAGKAAQIRLVGEKLVMEPLKL
ncbi:septum site-determining protein MinC [Aquabacterium sp. A7-Y]|uniref:septum site-determining protein MinC n=1 Tax=Aquabacterium sp. A7-Y TaxID=1349605 RepID=UPI00223CA6D3|nr:septum site-determining protein MinC [Aquabacterium sp. A7-Y]MCW7541935.1 septum site-determining protein MinC [Aquabacterium sp. A7-Y]